MKMRTLVTAVLLLSLATIAFAAKPKKYGKDLTLAEKTRVSEILASPEKYHGKRVLVEGTVTDVCKKRGCWLKIGSEKEFETIRFKVEDGVIVFPMTAKGKTARAEGIVHVTTLSREELIRQGQHQAQEEGTAFDSSSVKGPKTIIQINGEGAVIR